MSFILFRMPGCNKEAEKPAEETTAVTETKSLL
jgi:hypothetical protein